MAGLNIRITGDTRATQRRIRAAVRGGLGNEMKAALGRAAAPLQPAVKAEVAATLPSGYAPVLAGDVAVRTTLRGGGQRADALLRVSAKGRALAVVNRGMLRHPLYGNRNHWYAQRVRAGVVDRPVERMHKAVRAEFEKMVREVADRMGG